MRTEAWKLSAATQEGGSLLISAKETQLPFWFLMGIKGRNIYHIIAGRKAVRQAVGRW